MNILEPWISYRNDLWKTTLSTRPISQMDNLPSQCNTGPFFWFFGFFRGMIGLICHLQQKELGHGAVDNPIYRFAIYYKFLWLLGPLSHRFVDCLLSWVLMSCCLNHCIIAALIHFLAYPHTPSAGSSLLEQKGLKHLSEQTISNIFLEIWCHFFVHITLLKLWQSLWDSAERCWSLQCEARPGTEWHIIYTWIKSACKYQWMSGKDAFLMILHVWIPQTTIVQLRW